MAGSRTGVVRFIVQRLCHYTNVELLPESSLLVSSPSTVYEREISVAGINTDRCLWVVAVNPSKYRGHQSGSPRGFRDQGNMAIKLLGTREQKENKAENKGTKAAGVSDILGNRKYQNRKKKNV